MPPSIDPIAAIPPDREDGTSSWVHRLFIFLGRLGRINPAGLLPSWVALCAIACWPWWGQQVPAAGVAAAFLIADWIMLAALPWQKRSWGPVTPPLLGLTGVRVFISWTVALSFPALFPALPRSSGLAALTGIQILLSGLAVYSTWIEPFRLQISRHTLGAGPESLRCLHISDLHFEGLSPREQAVLECSRELAPDLILMSGDYLNLSSVYDPQAQAGARSLLAELHAPLGVYAVTGSPVVDVPGIVPRIFAELPIRWLDDEAVSIPYQGRELWLLGVRCTYNFERDIAALERLMRQPLPGAFTILLYHTPDLMPTAAALGVRLYLCGHTHGGQLRLPGLGALATASRWGKRYEMGRYQERETTLYVNRGLGMEGLGAPRARLLAPPELGLWELRP